MRAERQAIEYNPIASTHYAYEISKNFHFVASNAIFSSAHIQERRKKMPANKPLDNNIRFFWFPFQQLDGKNQFN